MEDSRITKINEIERVEEIQPGTGRETGRNRSHQDRFRHLRLRTS